MPSGRMLFGLELSSSNTKRSQALCMKMGFFVSLISGLFTNETGGILRMNTSNSYESDDLVVQLYAKKGNRVGFAESTVGLTEGYPPLIVIM